MNDPEEFFETLRRRRSVRQFRDEPVDRRTLERLVELATWAPSAGARQDWEFTVVTSAALRERMAERVRSRWHEVLSTCVSEAVREALGTYAANFDWFARAPVVIAVWARRPEKFLEKLIGELAPRVSGSHASAAMAVQNLMLGATALSLGSCCLTGPLAAEAELAELLGVDRRRQLVCLVAVGHPADSPRPFDRKPLERVARFVGEEEGEGGSAP